ncbi:hypothetical protein B9Z55_011940 [Caenorhabditis nigoni]|nr:hypothetical protein B9Z55_011940 [Caenorhabditis nigoni]
MSMLADKYGRKPIIVFSAILAFLANLAASFSPNYAVFLCLRAIVGASSDTYLSVGSVATCEYISEKARAWITVVYNVAWSLGMVWTLLVTLMTDDWRWRYFIVVFPGIYAFSLWCFLPESPHWLIVKNRTEKLKKYIETANRINKKTPDFSECQQSSHHEEKHESFKALLGSKKLIWILFANGFIEMVISLVYFAISFLCAELGGDHVRAFLFSSIVEIPGHVPNWLPYVVIALFSFISATLAFMLNETKNTKLPTDVESLTNPTEAADLAAYCSSTSSSTVSSISKKNTKSSKKHRLMRI